MALDTSAISNAANTALGLSNLILVSPQSTIGYQAQNFPSWKNDSSAQPPAILFNYEAEQSVSLSSDVFNVPLLNALLMSRSGLRNAGIFMGVSKPNDI